MIEGGHTFETMADKVGHGLKSTRRKKLLLRDDASLMACTTWKSGGIADLLSLNCSY